MKGIAVVMMIQVHIMELFAIPAVFESIIGKASLFLGGPFAAPVFLAVMGYFLAASNRSLTSLAGRGLKLILLGLALNIGLNLHLLIKIYSGAIDDDPLKYIFGADILFVAGISIILIASFRKISRDDLVPYLLLMLALPIFSSLLPESPREGNLYTYLGSFLWLKTDWSYFPFLPWFSYALLGYIFHRMEKTEHPWLIWIRAHRTFVFNVLMILLIVSSFYPVRVITDLPEYYHHGIYPFLWIAGFIGWLMLVLDRVLKEWPDGRVVRYLCWLGKNVTAVYVIQWLIIGNIATAIYRTQHLLWLFFWFAGILAMSSLLAYLYLRLYGRE